MEDFHMSYSHDYVVFIARIQPPHLAHVRIVEHALKLARKVIIMPGCADQPRTIKNPWTTTERENMLRAALAPEVQHRLIFRPIHDFLYNDQKWASHVQQEVKAAIFTDSVMGLDPSATYYTPPSPDTKIGIIGHSKDETSYYLKMFPQWTNIEVPNFEDIHATDIRTALFEMHEKDFATSIGKKLPIEIHNHIRAFTLTDIFEQLVNEYWFIKKYKTAWAGAPYPPIFVTCDAVVVQSGHILLVKRRAEPGRGLWALPGGFIGQNETISDAVIRELREETRVSVPEPVLRGSIKAQRVFDAPGRSLRGRTITHAFMFEFAAGPLPKVKGGDDAEKAKWVPLGTVMSMESQLFEDHYHIIMEMVE